MNKGETTNCLTFRLLGIIACDLLYINQLIISRCTTLNHLRVNMKHFLGPILGAEVAQKRAPFPAVVTLTEMVNANICILCDVVKKV